MDKSNTLLAGSPAQSYTPTDRYLLWVRDECCHLTPAQVRLLTTLATYADWTNGRCYPSMATLASKLAVCRGHIYRLLAELKAEGFINVCGWHGRSKMLHLAGYNQFIPPVAKQDYVPVTTPEQIALSQDRWVKNHQEIAPARIAIEEEPEPKPQPEIAAAALKPEAAESVAILATATSANGQRVNPAQAADLTRQAELVIRGDILPAELGRLAAIYRRTNVTSPGGWWCSAIQRHQSYWRGPDPAAMAERSARARRAPETTRKAVARVQGSTDTPKAPKRSISQPERQQVQRTGAASILAAVWGQQGFQQTQDIDHGQIH